MDKVLENKYVFESYENYEVHRLPFNRSLRDKCADFSFLSPLRRIFSLLEMIFSNFFLKAISYNNLYFFSRKLIKENNDIKIVIISGSPYHQFLFGYKLKNEFQIKWIADYRDEWNTNPDCEGERSLITKIVGNIQKKAEVKWLSNADFFITVSEHWKNSIASLIQRPGIVIKNGFNSYNPILNKTISNKFVIVYAGTFYASQKIELFVDACVKIDQMEQFKDKLIVEFIGTETLIGAHQHLVNLTKKHKSLFHFYGRLSKAELNVHMEKADVLLLTGFENVKGWYPVKLFEYFATKKPILMFPSDNDVMEEFIIETQSGFIANSLNEGIDLIKKMLEQKLSGNTIEIQSNSKAGEKYSRAYQTELLGDFLFKL
ncbi:MAG: glycosyltransferase family 4 protein [Flavobacteriales bacterium]|nr:glycosyltransferase family 4 protein [Flavobacteriales bacterium]